MVLIMADISAIGPKGLKETKFQEMVKDKDFNILTRDVVAIVNDKTFFTNTEGLYMQRR